jgi:hypothetical protein
VPDVETLIAETAAQLDLVLRQEAGALVGRQALGRWPVEHTCLPGNRQPWAEHGAAATGEALKPGYLVRARVP